MLVGAVGCEKLLFAESYVQPNSTWVPEGTGTIVGLLVRIALNRSPVTITSRTTLSITKANLLLETMVGRGGVIGTSFSELYYIYSNLNNKNTALLNVINKLTQNDKNNLTDEWKRRAGIL